MIRKFLRLCWRECVLCCKDPRRLIFLFGAALAYMALFYLLYSPNIVKNIPVTICDEDDSVISREIVKRIGDNDFFHEPVMAATQEEVLEDLHEQRAVLGVVIPRDFSKEILRGRSQTLLLALDGTNLMPVSTSVREMENLLAVYGNELAAQNVAQRTGLDRSRAHRKTEPFRVTTRMLGNPIQGYAWFFLIGLGIAAFQQGQFFATGSSMFQDDPEGRRGIPPALLYVQKLVFYTVAAFFSYSMALGAMTQVADIPRKAPLSVLLLLGLVFSFALTALGLWFASLFSSEYHFVQCSLIYPVVGFILAGYTWPLAAMPAPLQIAAHFLPQTWFMEPFRQCLLLGVPADYWEHIEVLTGMGVFFTVLGAWSCWRKWPVTQDFLSEEAAADR